MALATLLLLGTYGCTNVTGGAVELSWSLNQTDGSRIDACSTAGVGRIRLNWKVGTDDGFDAWPCEDFHGVTGFEIPKGTALLSVVPECLSGQPANATFYQAPAPVARTIAEGDVVELHAIVIQLPDCSNNTCSKQCTP